MDVKVVRKILGDGIKYMTDPGVEGIIERDSVLFNFLLDEIEKNIENSKAFSKKWKKRL